MDGEYFFNMGFNGIHEILTFGQKMMIYVGILLVCNELMKGILSIIQYRINHEKYSNYYATVRFPWLQHLGQISNG